MLCCRNVTKLYKNETVIEDVSITVESGETVGVIGRSGVGKSTLLNILSGLDPPDSGRVFFKGEDITGRPGHIGYMQQKDLLLPFKTLIDNVSLPLILRGQSKKPARRQALEALPRFGLEGSGELYPGQLSGGMRQRAALLRTWLFSGSAVLLDEPFSALDFITRSDLQRWYLDLISELGMTALLITHDLDEAITMCDRIYVMGGPPGAITHELKIGGPKPPGFNVSREFLTHKITLTNMLSAERETL